MAHIAKYKAPSVGHMLAHYRRDRSSLERDNIDPERIKNDLVVGHYTNKDGKLVVGRVEPREGEPNWGTVESRIERVNEAQKADRELSRVRAQVTECKAKIDGFAARFEKLKTELAQIAEALSVRGFLGSFKAKLIEFAENEICKAALAAGRDFKTARDGKRAERVLVNGAREKVDEMSALGEEMDEWSLLDEVGDMRGARRELDDHEAPARPRDNQVL